MTKALDRLIAAAEAYGDAAVIQSRELYAWKRGDPQPRAFDRELAHELNAAARAYATSTRRKRTPADGAGHGAASTTDVSPVPGSTTP